MAEVKQTKRRNWGLRLLIAALIFILLLVAIVIGLRVWISSSGGRAFVEKQIESREFGPVRKIEIAGLSGDVLTEFSVVEIRLHDVNGHFATLSDLTMDWSPLALRKRHLVIRDLDVAEADLLRRPILTSENANEDARPFTADIGDADIAALILGEPVIGQAASLRVDAQGGLRDSGTLEAKLNVVRIDAEGDVLDIDFTRTEAGEMNGDFVLDGAVGGTFATLLRAPDGQVVTGRGTISGTLETGEGDLDIVFGDQPAASAMVGWTPAAADLDGIIRTTNWPIFDSSRETLGEELAVKAQLDRAVEPTGFTANIAATNFEADLSGRLKEENSLPEEIAFDVRSSKLDALLPMPDGYSLGGGKAAGRLRLADGLSGNADIDIANIVTPQGRADRVSGPVRLTPDGPATAFDVRLTATNPVTSRDLPITLGRTATLTAKGRVDSEARCITDLDAVLTSVNDRITAKGSAAFDATTMNLLGSAKMQIKPIGSVPAGAVETSYALRKTAESDLAISAAGDFLTQAGFQPPLTDLLGDQVNFDVKMAPLEGGVRITDGRVRSEGLRTAFGGRVTEALDLSAEVSILQPLTISALSLTEPSQFSATLTGPRADPDLRLDGTVPALTLAGQDFSDVRLRTELADLVTAPKGPVRIEAETDYGPLDLSARMTSTEAGYAASDIALGLNGLTAGGDLALGPDNIATGRLELNLPQQDDRYARAFVDLEEVEGEQGVNLRAEAKNVAYGNYAIDSLSAAASGTLAGLSGEMAVSGQQTDTILTREFGLNSPFGLRRDPETGYTLTFRPEADYGRYRIGHSGTVTLRYNDGDIAANAPLLLNGEPVNLEYARANGLETVTADVTNLPMNVLPLPGALAESKGRLSLDLSLRHSPTEQLSGQAVIKMTDWRGLDIDRGEGLTITTTLDLEPSALVWRLENRTESELDLSGNGRIGLLPGESLTAIRPDMMAPMRGRLSARGSAKPLLNLVTLDDAKPDGTLTAELDIAGTLGAPRVEGQATGRDLRMELPQLGTQIRKGRFTADFTNDTIDVRDVYIEDSSDGTLRGGGQFKLGEFGRPIGKLEVQARNFRALDRKDYEGRADGTIYFESDAEKATIGGDVKIDRAEVKQFVAGRVAVVEIEVEEINGQMDELETRDAAPAVPIYLDLRVRAPRRIFVRTRGLDVELEMDVTIKGTTDAPELYGSASVLRGGYRIAGKELAFNEGGITFDGKLADAKVNLVAETDTQNIAARVNITGTVEEPEIELSSTPERPQDEILSALLFGRSVTELSTIEAAQLAGALAQFSGQGGGFDLMGGLRDALGVGQLSIGVGEDGNAVVSGGRYLAKDVYLQIFTGAGPEATGAIIDWEIRRNLSLRSKVQADSQQSFSLKYKRDF